MLKKKRKDEQVVCKVTDTEKIRANLKQRKIIFPSCSIADGEYEVKVINEAGVNFAIEERRHRFIAGKIRKNRGVEVLMDMNPHRKDDLNLFQGTECDETASPLFIDLRKNAKDLDILSSPDRGVQFDILGANAFPTPHSQIQISWFEKGKFALLTLPNKNGQVDGVDELFGNNTAGPDGKFADNGFLALAKFDSNKDEVIDEDDAIFSSLRLWLDKNRDGKAQPYELQKLGQEDIIAIDLKYDAKFYEKDKYGNEIKFKSVVRKLDGSVKPVFDVWFAITQ